jgi:hypothetical protein
MMIHERWGYKYKNKTTSVEYIYTKQDKTKLFDDFCRLAGKFEMSLKGVKVNEVK